MRPSPGERLSAWALMGPPGRAYSLARDLIAMAAMLVAYLARRVAGAVRPGGSG